MDRDEPVVLEALDRIFAPAKEHGRAAGIFTGSTEYASRMVERGFRFVTVLSDGRLPASAAAQTVAAIQGEDGVIRGVH